MGYKTMNMTISCANLRKEDKKKAVNILKGLTAAPQKPSEKSMSQNVTYSDLTENPSQQTKAKLLK